MSSGISSNISDAFSTGASTRGAPECSSSSLEEGTKGDRNSWSPSLSTDGTRVAFHSESTNLDPDDTDAGRDVYVKNLLTGEEVSSTRVWPFYTTKLSADGRRQTYVLDILPFDELSPRFERLYSRWWRIFRKVEGGPEDHKGWEVLWGLVKSETRPDQRRFSILGGLFEWRVRKGRTRWRFFYIPI